MRLTEVETRWALSLIEAVFPQQPSDKGDHIDHSKELRAFLQDIFANGPITFTLLARVVFILLQLMPLFIIGRLKLFINLSADDKDRFLMALYNSRWYLLRQLGLLVKLIGGLGYLGIDHVRERFCPLNPEFGLKKGGNRA